MPLLTLHIVRLSPSKSVRDFIQQLQSSPEVEVVLASQPRQFVIRPEHLDVDVHTSSRWDLVLLITSPAAALPESLRSSVQSEYKIAVGVPSKLLARYPEHNARLVADAPNVKLTGALDQAQRKMKESAQNLELSPELLTFMEELTHTYGDKPVTMLNLLHFNEDGKSSYHKYGQAFVKVAGLRGGDAKIVGNVVAPPAGTSDSRGDRNRAEATWWNEISLVHYPSIRAFCDMLAGEDYQEINAKYRLNALKDTMLLCTTEIGLESDRRRAKL